MSKTSPLTLPQPQATAFNPDKAEMKAWFDTTPLEAKDPTHVPVVLDESDFEKFDDFFEEILELYKYTGFNPADYRNYLDTQIFVTPKFNPTTKGQTIGMLIMLFISRGNKLSVKNKGRMKEKGKAAIQKLKDLFGTLFKETYNADELLDSTITPARVAAAYPMETVRLLQKFHQSRIVGKPPKGLPRGFSNSVSFSVIPRSCTNLLRAMGIWRDSFSLTINPKARSPYAQWLVKASAYNFSRVALDSNFISEADRIRTTVMIAMMSYASATDPMEKVLTLYWVDLPNFLEEAIKFEKVPAISPAPTDIQSLINYGFRMSTLEALTKENLAQLLAMINGFFRLVSPALQKTTVDETKLWPIENTSDIDEIIAVGNLGGRDQGASFEVLAKNLLKSSNQPGLSFPAATTPSTAPQTLPVPAFLSQTGITAPTSSPQMSTPGVSISSSILP